LKIDKDRLKDKLTTALIALGFVAAFLFLYAFFAMKSTIF
jgi:hypothetical protein